MERKKKEKRVQVFCWFVGVFFLNLGKMMISKQNNTVNKEEVNSSKLSTLICQSSKLISYLTWKDSEEAGKGKLF